MGGYGKMIEGRLLLKTRQLKPGMITAKKILNSEGILVMEECRILTDDDIRVLRANRITDVTIFNCVDDDIEEVDINDGIYGEYVDSIRNSMEFQEFEAEFTEATELLKDKMNRIVNENLEIDIEDVIVTVKGIVASAGNTGSLMDMLSCLRGFDDETYVHSLNVALISSTIAKWMNLPQHRIDEVMLAGLLHDIGKIKVDKEILNKKSRLKPNEYEHIQTHAVQGYKIVEYSSVSRDVKLGVLQHHEKCDGSGYPLGCTGEKIGWIPKILTIADIYDAMTSRRCYREPISPFEVLKQFEDDGFNKYGTKELLTFFNGIADTYLGRMVMLSDGQVGEIIYINRTDVARPIVRTKKGYIDTSKEKSIRIEGII